MYVTLWGFLTVSVVFSLLFVMFLVYLGHRKTMKQLEIDALQTENELLQTQAPSKKLESRLEALEAMVGEAR